MMSFLTLLMILLKKCLINSIASIISMVMTQWWSTVLISASIWTKSVDIRSLGARLAFRLQIWRAECWTYLTLRTKKTRVNHLNKWTQHRSRPSCKLQTESPNFLTNAIQTLMMKSFTLRWVVTWCTQEWLSDWEQRRSKVTSFTWDFGMMKWSNTTEAVSILCKVSKSACSWLYQWSMWTMSWLELPT